MINMKQSFSWWCFENRGVDNSALLKTARQIGYQGVELIPQELWQEAIAEGLTVVNIAGHRPLEIGFNHRSNHDKLIVDVSQMILLASQNNIPFVTVFSGNREGINDSTGLSNTVLGLRKVIDLAEKLNVTLILELLNSKLDHPDHQCDRTSWGVAVCELVGSPNLKLLYDIYHMQIMEGDVIQNLHDNIKFIGHIHTAGVPGRNDIDDSQELFYPAVFKSLNLNGYNGYIGHEFLPKGEPLAALKYAFDITNI